MPLPYAKPQQPRSTHSAPEMPKPCRSPISIVDNRPPSLHRADSSSPPKRARQQLFGATSRRASAHVSQQQQQQQHPYSSPYAERSFFAQTPQDSGTTAGGDNHGRRTSQFEQHAAASPSVVDRTRRESIPIDRPNAAKEAAPQSRTQRRASHTTGSSAASTEARGNTERINRHTRIGISGYEAALSACQDSILAAAREQRGLHERQRAAALEKRQRIFEVYGTGPHRGALSDSPPAQDPVTSAAAGGVDGGDEDDAASVEGVSVEYTIPPPPPLPRAAAPSASGADDTAAAAGEKEKVVANRRRVVFATGTDHAAATGTRQSRGTSPPSDGRRGTRSAAIGSTKSTQTSAGASAAAGASPAPDDQAGEKPPPTAERDVHVPIPAFPALADSRRLLKDIENHFSLFRRYLTPPRSLRRRLSITGKGREDLAARYPNVSTSADYRLPLSYSRARNSTQPLAKGQQAEAGAAEVEEDIFFDSPLNATGCGEHPAPLPRTTASSSPKKHNDKKTEECPTQEDVAAVSSLALGSSTEPPADVSESTWALNRWQQLCPTPRQLYSWEPQEVADAACAIGQFVKPPHAFQSAAMEATERIMRRKSPHLERAATGSKAQWQYRVPLKRIFSDRTSTQSPRMLSRATSPIVAEVVKSPLPSKSSSPSHSSDEARQEEFSKFCAAARAAAPRPLHVTIPPHLYGTHAEGIDLSRRQHVDVLMGL